MKTLLKTLIIHPADPTTDFLKEIYRRVDATIYNGNDKSSVQQLLREHDRVILLGHGTEDGLLSPSGYVVDHSLGRELRHRKKSIFIWCNADEYAKKHRLTGFVTGMFVSEPMEARMYGLRGTDSQIRESNEKFAILVNQFDSYAGEYQAIKVSHYYRFSKPTSDITEFNAARLYYFKKGIPRILYVPAPLNPSNN